MIINVKNGELEPIIDGSRVVVVEFHGAKCPDCKRMEQVLVELNEEFLQKNLIIAKLDIADIANRKLAVSMSLSSVPHIMVYHNGAVVVNRNGFMPLNLLSEQVSTYIETK